MDMEKLYNYIVYNYTLSSEAKRMLDSIVEWAFDWYSDMDGKLTDQGIDFIERIVADNIGMERKEIEENWG